MDIMFANETVRIISKIGRQRSESVMGADIKLFNEEYAYKNERNVYKTNAFLKIIYMQ